MSPKQNPVIIVIIVVPEITEMITFYLSSRYIVNTALPPIYIYLFLLHAIFQMFLSFTDSSSSPADTELEPLPSLPPPATTDISRNDDLDTITSL